MESNILAMSKEVKEMTVALGDIQEKMKGVNEAFSEFSAFKDSTAVIRENIKSIGEELSILKKPSGLEILGDVINLTGSLGSFVMALKESRKSIGKELEKVANVLKNNDNIQEAVNKLGKDIANGLINGIKEMKPKLMLLVQELGEDNIIKTVVKEFQISTSSDVMKKLGQDISEGLGDGIKDGGKHIKAAMGSAVDTIEDASKKMSKIKFGLGGLTAITALVVPLIDYFGDMLRSNETLGKKMEQIWAKITEAFKPVTDTVMNLFNQFTSGSGSSVSALDTLLAAVNSAAVVLAGVIESIAGFFKEYGDEIITVVRGVWSVISDLVSGAIGVLGGAFDVITGIFTGNGEKIKDGFRDIFEGIKSIFGGLTGFFSGLWSNIKSVFTSIGSTIGSGIGNAFKAVINTILDFAGDLINKFIKAINKAIGTINKIPGVEIGKLSTISIPKLASGGIVTPGQLFLAREAGPELVGNFGARTAVMNNNQIVESVSRGVYNAVTDALNRNNSGPFVFHVHTYLDGREVAQNVIKHHNRMVNCTGRTPLKI